MTGGSDRRAVVIDDDPGVRQLLVEILTGAGFDVVGVDAVRTHDPAITTLDVNMPGIDGYETARRIRAESDSYILMITGLADEADAVLGFSVGADDVVVKPFRVRELRARILAAERRHAARAPAPTGPIDGSPAANIGWRGLSLNRQSRAVTIDGEPLALTRTEFDLLASILTSGSDVLTKADLVRVAHGAGAHITDADERAIETHITNLRRKLGETAATPRFIETVRGVGYRAIVEPAAPN
jgi:two-component system, OmpR family, response regulator